MNFEYRGAGHAGIGVALGQSELALHQLVVERCALEERAKCRKAVVLGVPSLTASIRLDLCSKISSSRSPNSRHSRG
jgi:hypothetical protein